MTINTPTNPRNDFVYIYILEYVALFDVAIFNVTRSHRIIRTCFISGFWIASMVLCIMRTSRSQFISAIIP